MKSYAIFLGVVTVLLVIYAYVDSRPDTVVLSGDKWQCDVAVPKGLRTVCTVYSVRVK
jgi:hypothetical protein